MISDTGKQIELLMMCLGRIRTGRIVEFYQGTTAQQVSGYLPDWSFEYYTTSTTNNVTTQVVNTVTASQGLTAITNREYEYNLNESKREIIFTSKISKFTCRRT